MALLEHQQHFSVVVFIDDILIYSKSYEEHLHHVKLVFDLLREHQFEVRLSKCSFAKQQLNYLGHVLSAEGIATYPSKISIIQNWPVPTSVKELRSFLGMAGYYRRFVQNFGMMAKPLIELLKKGQLFVWTSDQEQSFQALKNALITAPVLAVPDFKKPFVVITDASDKGIGAVLQQGGHPIAFVSKALGPKNRGLSTYEKESLAILMVVDHWRPYLQSSEFIIHTDQRSLVHLDDQRLHTYWQQKALSKLMGLQYKICYKKGTNNAVADALLRIPEKSPMELYSLTTVQPVWLQEIQDSYSTSDKAQSLLSGLTVQSNQDQFQLIQGRQKGRIWLGHSMELQNKVTKALHDSPIGGHSGYLVTYNRIKKLFIWPAMKQSVQDYTSNCVTCQQAKTERISYPGLLQPLLVPDQAWQVVTLDFI